MEEIIHDMGTDVEWHVAIAYDKNWTEREIRYMCSREGESTFRITSRSQTDVGSGLI